MVDDQRREEREKDEEEKCAERLTNFVGTTTKDQFGHRKLDQWHEKNIILGIRNEDLERRQRAISTFIFRSKRKGKEEFFLFCQLNLFNEEKRTRDFKRPCRARESKCRVKRLDREEAFSSVAVLRHRVTSRLNTLTRRPPTAENDVPEI